VATRVPVLVVVAYLLLGSAWLVGNPPGAAPDEGAHYLKALAAGRGELYLGRRPPAPADPERLEATARWHATTSRLVRIPDGLDPAPLFCFAFHPDISAGCQRLQPVPGPGEARTIVGPYQPFTYVLPGLLMRAGDDPSSAMRWGRLGFSAVSAALLALAVLLLRSPRGGGYWLIGPVVALTPMVAFMVSTLSANGLEIAAGFCFAAALLRMARGEEEAEAWVWAAAAVSGALLALARVTGVLWLVLSVLSVVALAGARPMTTAVRRAGRRAVWAIAAVVAAIVATVAWELAVQPHPRRSLGAASRGLRTEVEELPDIFDQAIGVFGWLDTRMPTVAYRCWTVLLLGLLVAALVCGGRRQRLALAGLTVGSVVATLAVATLNRPTGFGVQARYVLPFVTLVPMAAGEILLANRERTLARNRGAAWLPVVFVVPAAAVHLVGWLANGRRYAVGVPGPWAFMSRAEWSPPLGWWVWLAVTGVAALALVVAAVAAARDDPGRPAIAVTPAGTGTSEPPGRPEPGPEPTPDPPAPGPRAPGPRRDGS
jgi:hypothetical protein